ncbi:MAG: ABC transporter ATP-binding protein [Methylobacteriaceae bacterium]|nr:ABC transporter ATP-binding protein [Methylobacteriaceae bacterium]
MTGAGPERVALCNIAKSFGELVAVDDASMSIRRGEVHALVGENGAGKTTLMNILYGLLSRTSGDILLDGTPVAFKGPAEAIRAGIGMVHQHFKLAPSFTVAENIILGSEPLSRLGQLDRLEADRRTRALSQRFGFDLDPEAIVGTLPIGLRQRVEILKALYREAEILILDEPTSVLTPQETRELFATMRSLAANGRSIVFITHKLKEVLAVSDRISVMRHGRIIATTGNSGVSAEQLARLMVGRPVLMRVVKTRAHPGGAAALKVENLTVIGDRGETAVADLSLAVRPGEIVGLAGVQGNGQDELVQCIAGLRRPLSGRVEICGTAVAGREPLDCRAAGLAYIPADRGRVGLSRASRVWENMTLGHQAEFARGPFLAARSARARSAELIRRFDVRGANVDTPAASLSGGNQQKVQLARELTRAAAIILAEQPSQGVDIGAIEAIHRILVEMRDSGRAVFVISADLDEIFALSDRILVIFRGRIVADLTAEETDFEEIGRFMGGIEGPSAGLGRATASSNLDAGDRVY